MNHAEIDEARSFLNPMCGMATVASAFLFCVSAAGTGYLYATGGNPTLGKQMLSAALGGLVSTAFSAVLLNKSEPPSVPIPKNHRRGLVAGMVLAAAGTFGTLPLFNIFGDYVSRPAALNRPVDPAPAGKSEDSQSAKLCKDSHGLGVVVGVGDKQRVLVCPK